MSRVCALRRHPVKSMQGEDVDSADLGTAGIPGDRRYAVRDTTTGTVLSAKREARLLLGSARTVGSGASEQVEIELPDGAVWAAADPGVHVALSEWLGRPVLLEEAAVDKPGAYEMNSDAEDPDSPVVSFPCPPGTYFDAAPVHLLTTTSARQWDRRRFRATVLVETDPAAEEGGEFPEDDWIGSTLALGQAEIAVFAPTVRCVITTRAQPGLDSDLEVVKWINRHHQSNLGVYAVVRTPGRVAVGDPVTLQSPPC
ncbi:MAG: MOSC domain-containing protein [Acidimicrobiales bacterium]